MKISSILGLNARTQLYAYRYNSRRGKSIADSKILTARTLAREEVSHPKIYKKFRNPNDVLSFDWDSLPDKFALKPNKGLGGGGIIVVKKRATDGKGWFTTQWEKVSVADLKLHTLDILEGAYSMGNEPDVAFIQEYVGRAEVFKKWAYRGTPDIRVIVFNKVPVMAMLRLPTKESSGRANLHQGALGVGVDIATGITTKAIWHGDQIVFKPGTERKLRGIKIPNWDKVLTTAVKASIGAGLGYAGIDIVIHPEKGPMVLEMNAQPGLQIQLANMEALRTRLNRVDDLEVTDAEHGVKIAKVLFAGRYENRTAMNEGIKTLKGLEEVKIYGFDSTKSVKVLARVDTGAVRSSVDKDLAVELGLLNKKNILWKDTYRSASGVQARPVIDITYAVAGKRIKTSASVADRSKMSTPFLIGRNDMAGFVINPN